MHTIRPRRRWGQNFLIDKNIARKIAAAAFTSPPPRLIIEIGPGTGALTDLLLKETDPYIGVEVDPKLSQQLLEKFSEKSNFSLIQQDFLKTELSPLLQNHPGLNPVIVGNIPYNITTPILFKLFDHADELDGAILMMQKEVGERLIAVPSTKQYGLLAINSQLFAEVEKLTTVPAHLFSPKPKVDSVVIQLRFKKGVKASFSDFNLFRKVLRHCFQHRRKMLRKSLSMLFSSADLRKLNIDLTQRPEQLSIQSWKELSEVIHLHL